MGVARISPGRLRKSPRNNLFEFFLQRRISKNFLQESFSAFFAAESYLGGAQAWCFDAVLANARCAFLDSISTSAQLGVRRSGGDPNLAIWKYGFGSSVSIKRTVEPVSSLCLLGSNLNSDTHALEIIKASGETARYGHRLLYMTRNSDRDQIEAADASVGWVEDDPTGTGHVNFCPRVC
jgi:hypothetical protein